MRCGGDQACTHAGTDRQYTILSLANLQNLWQTIRGEDLCYGTISLTVFILRWLNTDPSFLVFLQLSKYISIIMVQYRVHQFNILKKTMAKLHERIKPKLVSIVCIDRLISFFSSICLTNRPPYGSPGKFWNILKLIEIISCHMMGWMTWDLSYSTLAQKLNLPLQIFCVPSPRPRLLPQLKCIISYYSKFLDKSNVKVRSSASASY